MHKKQENGRSMIEMLGILAIIGVLTVGSITGYSKAMRRHLLNKQREQYNYILHNIEANRDMLVASLNAYGMSGYLRPAFETFDWIPKEMIKDNSIYTYDILNNRILFSCSRSSTLQQIMMIIDIDQDAYEQCLNLFQIFQPYHAFVSLELWGNTSGSREAGSDDARCATNRNYLCLKDLAPAKITQLCHHCNQNDSCKFYVFLHRLFFR